MGLVDADTAYWPPIFKPLGFGAVTGQSLVDQSSQLTDFTLFYWTFLEFFGQLKSI